ncbi:MAG: GTP-binding protein [Luteolibacter sp.]|uniref:GTP-binding protein n=1 Tax=Luteolibacter sp. TaxID=1962973 RepID=UPI003263FCCE
MISSNPIEQRASDKQKRLILVGGFLGAGKTTLIGKLIRHLQTGGLRCGVVTNDQATGLVDTALAETLDGARISEIAGGCFCCKLDQLEGMLTGQWQDDPASSPDVIVAEPVGSCTDLIATVVLPLRRIYGEAVVISPFSVVLDGRRALASLGGRRTPGDFSKDVGYIYRKQIEEAEIVVVNKRDLLTGEDVADLLARIESNFPEKEVFLLSARTGEGLAEWAERITATETAPQRLMEVDYERYGIGEALLGWCNAEAEVTCQHPENGDSFLSRLSLAISSTLAEQSFEVAHFKMALTDADGRLGVINQVLSGTAPEISRSFGGDFRHGRLTVNLRAEGDPDRLREIVEQCVRQISQDGVTAELREMAAFRPGQPVPVERVTML